MGLPHSHPKSRPTPWSECTLTALGTWTPPEITWPSHDNHTTMHHPHTLSAGHLAGRPGSNPLSFQSISILLCANTSLIALQLSSVSLCSFPTWSPFVCAPVPCLHPCLFHPHADSHLSDRYSLVSILIAYTSQRPCVFIC